MVLRQTAQLLLQGLEALLKRPSWGLLLVPLVLVACTSQVNDSTVQSQQSTPSDSQTSAPTTEDPASLTTLAQPATTQESPSATISSEEAAGDDVVAGCIGVFEGADFTGDTRPRDELDVCVEVLDEEFESLDIGSLFEAYCYGFAFGMNLAEAAESETEETFQFCIGTPEQSQAVVLEELRLRISNFTFMTTEEFVSALQVAPALFDLIVFYESLFEALPEGEYDTHLTDPELVVITANMGHQLCQQAGDQEAGQRLLDGITNLWFLTEEEAAMNVFDAVAQTSIGIWCPEVLSDQDMDS